MCDQDSGRLEGSILAFDTVSVPILSSMCVWLVDGHLGKCERNEEKWMSVVSARFQWCSGTGNRLRCCSDASYDITDILNFSCDRFGGMNDVM